MWWILWDLPGGGVTPPARPAIETTGNLKRREGGWRAGALTPTLRPIQGNQKSEMLAGQGL